MNDALGDEARLDTEITGELKEEGEVRAFVRGVQELRKKAGLTPAERAVLCYAADDEGEEWFSKHRGHISTRTKVEFERVRSPAGGVEYKIGSSVITLGMSSVEQHTTE